jgi:hypothetical protein
VDLGKIRKSLQFKKLLSLGYEDTTSPRQVKNGTISLRGYAAGLKSEVQYITIHSNGYVRFGRADGTFAEHGIVRMAPIRQPSEKNWRMSHGIMPEKIVEAFKDEDDMIENGVGLVIRRIEKQEAMADKRNVRFYEDRKWLFKYLFERAEDGTYYVDYLLSMLEKNDLVTLLGMITKAKTGNYSRF